MCNSPTNSPEFATVVCSLTFSSPDRLFLGLRALTSMLFFSMATTMVFLTNELSQLLGPNITTSLEATNFICSRFTTSDDNFVAIKYVFDNTYLLVATSHIVLYHHIRKWKPNHPSPPLIRVGLTDSVGQIQMGLGPVELDENSDSGINFFDSNGHGSCCLDRGNYTVSGWSSSRSSVIELNYTIESN